jgi:RNA polymerase sigma-32 factor
MSFAINNLPSLTSDLSIVSYLRAIKDIPSLTQNEEYSLAVRYREYNDISAAQKLVSSHLKLVAKIAVSYKNYGLPINDLISEGNIGLMQAVKRFEPEKGFRLSTYAIWWIKASMQEFILKSWSMVKIGTTSAQKKLFFNLGKIKRKIFSLEAREINESDYSTIAEELQVNENDVAEMHQRMNRDKSLNAPINQEDLHLVELGDTLSSGESHEELIGNSQEKALKLSMMHKAMEQLQDREKYILVKRRLSKPLLTLEELKQELGISKQRINQIETKAFEKLQKITLSLINEKKSLLGS